MRKIAIIQRFLPSRSRGGVGHFTHGLAQVLCARGNAVTVFSQDPAPAGARYDVQQVAMRGGFFSPLEFPWALRRCDFSGFDVIHAQGDEQWLSRRFAPIVRTMHGTALAEAWFNGVRAGSVKRFLLHLYFYAMEVIADLRADRVAGVSAGTGKFYPRMDVVIPNGIDLERFTRAAETAEKSAAPSVIFIGELESRKRGSWLVEQFVNGVRPRVQNAELWLVSPDVPAAGADSGVIHCGTPDDASLAALLARAWVMCLPSAYEGFGRPYAEAMAAGTVAAATPNPGADDVLDNGQAGLIASDSELPQALSSLLSDSAARARFVDIGRRRAEAYDWPRVAEAYERCYDDARAAWRRAS